MHGASRQRIRDFWFEVHKYLGLATLLFLVLAGLTGSLLVFKADLDEALNPDLFRARAGPVLPAAELAHRLEAERPDLRVVRLPLNPRSGHAVVLGVVGRDGAQPPFDQVFVDPTDGRLIGVRKDAPGWSRRGLMQGVYQLHYTLLAGTPGRWLMGAVATGWLVGNVVGFYLTLPRGGPFWRKWRPLWTVKSGVSLPRLLLDLHRASGLWLIAFVLVLSLTSAALNFYDEAVEPAAIALSPPGPSPFDPGRPTLPPGHTPRIGFAPALGAARAAAARERPGWRPVTALYVPDRGLYGVTFTRSGRDDYAGLGPVAYYFADDDGRFAYRDDPGRDSAGRAVLRSIYPLHSGQVFGWPTRLLVMVLGLATAEMALTGVYVWWKKRKPRAAAKRARLQASRA